MTVLTLWCQQKFAPVTERAQMITVFVIYSQTVKFRENGANAQLSMFLILALTERTEDFVPATEPLYATLRMAQENFEKS